MMVSITDWAAAISPHIEPVASRQKQTSMNPNAGRGISSLKLGLSLVAFTLLLLSVLITPVTGAGNGIALMLALDFAFDNFAF